MTDNEIIKAVECCVGNTKCGECPMFRTSNCMNKVFGYALDLINRKKAEIERLKQIIDKQDKEIIKLQKRIIFWREDLNYQPEKIKSEAIKEFAEELKNYFSISECYLDIINIIDNLVKEMTE